MAGSSFACDKERASFKDCRIVSDREPRNQRRIPSKSPVDLFRDRSPIVGTLKDQDWMAKVPAQLLP